MVTELTHSNFDSAINDCRAGKCEIYLPTAYKVIKIDAKCVKKYEAAGMNVLKKSMDGKGFRIARGRKHDYVFAGYLKVVTIGGAA